MEWKYVKPLYSSNSITEFEEIYKFSFPNDYKDYIKQYNGGRPNLYVFDTDKTKERTIKSLLSFNKEDKETIWNINEWNNFELSEKYIAFGIDNFGNLICFNISSGHIVFLNMEDSSIELIAETFSKFIEKLYD